MPLVPDFSASQSLGELNILSLEDISTGSDVSITRRLVYIQSFDGSYLVPEGTTTDYIVWAIEDSTIDIDVLNKDYSLLVTVVWVHISTPLYTKIILFSFTGYTETFELARTRDIASNQKLINSANYWYNYSKLRTLIDNAEQAVALGNDQTASQINLDLAYQIIQNLNYFY